MTTGNDEVLNRSLLQQVGPADLIASTRTFLQKHGKPNATAIHSLIHLGNQNILTAWKAGVLLITGSDAGNMLVLHGPTVQHEMELWVKAGIPVAVALEAATGNAAKVLRADKRIGFIRPGYDANLLLLDANPLENIANTEHVTGVMFHGEIVDRPNIFDQDSK